MADLYLTRKIFTDKSTIGKLVFGDLELWTLEDTARNTKVKNETCIPSGIYGIELRHSSLFGRIMPFLINVPYYEGIMIHSGNTPSDTKGCILVGTSHTMADVINESRNAFSKLYPRIEEELKKGPVRIHIAGGFNADEMKLKKAA